MLLWEHAAILISVLIVLLGHGSGRRSGANARSIAGGCVDYMLWVPRPVQGHLWRGCIVQLLGPHVGRAGGDSVSGDISLSCFEVMFSFVLCEAVGVHGGLWRGLVMPARFAFSRRNPVVAPMTLLTVFPPRREEEDSLLTGPVLFWLMGLWSLGPVVLWPVSLETMLLMVMWCLVQVALWPVLVKAMLLLGLWCLGPVALWPVLVEAMLLMELW